LLEVLQLGVAAWMVYEAVRAVTTVPPWLQPLLVAAVCYSLTWAPPVVLTVLCASAVCAAFRMLVALTARPEPWTPGKAPKLPKRSRIPNLP
jgi:hypothetical protein